MTDLSPAADAVLDAYMTNCGWLDGPLEKDYCCAASVLRAATDQVLPEEPLYGGDQRWMFERDARQESRKKLLAIANELENVNG